MYCPVEFNDGEFEMSNKETHEDKDRGLAATALKRAAKQFPEFDANEVVKAVEQQHAQLMAARPLVDMPMRDLRTMPRHDI